MLDRTVPPTMRPSGYLEKEQNKNKNKTSSSIKSIQAHIPSALVKPVEKVVETVLDIHLGSSEVEPGRHREYQLKYFLTSISIPGVEFMDD